MRKKLEGVRDEVTYNVVGELKKKFINRALWKLRHYENEQIKKLSQRIYKTKFPGLCDDCGDRAEISAYGSWGQEFLCADCTATRLY
jgi:hypothetical protein